VIVVAAVLLGLVFLAAGVTKKAAPQQWRSQSADLGVPHPLTVALPSIEVAVGALLVAQVARRAVAVAALVLLASFTALLIRRLSQGRRPPCACFGSWSSKPIGWIDVARNATFVALAAFLIAAA
jgi:uncharacterized membrane protein YphA (DoxX/SURF4 family)